MTFQEWAEELSLSNSFLYCVRYGFHLEWDHDISIFLKYYFIFMNLRLHSLQDVLWNINPFLLLLFFTMSLVVYSAFWYKKDNRKLFWSLGIDSVVSWKITFCCTSIRLSFTVQWLDLWHSIPAMKTSTWCLHIVLVFILINYRYISVPAVSKPLITASMLNLVFSDL